MRLFQLAHANRHPENRFDYSIKHYFLLASSLHRAHVYVTLYGHRITPDFYEDGDTIEDVEHPPYFIDSMEQRMLEQYEQANEGCSFGEHYWHSIKELDAKKYDGKVIEVNDGNRLFKLTIRFKHPGQYNMYQFEQNTFVYQLRAAHEDDVLRYLYEHFEQFSLTAEMLMTQFHKPSLEDIRTWSQFSSLCKESLKCQDPSENAQHEKIVLELTKMDDPILTHSCSME